MFSRLLYLLAIFYASTELNALVSLLYLFKLIIINTGRKTPESPISMAEAKSPTPPKPSSSPTISTAVLSETVESSIETGFYTCTNSKDLEEKHI